MSLALTTAVILSDIPLNLLSLEFSISWNVFLAELRGRICGWFVVGRELHTRDPRARVTAIMFEAPVVIDGRGHLLGRLASVVAKELLGGQKVIIVRCEQITISGSRECCLLARASPMYSPYPLLPFDQGDHRLAFHRI